MTRAHHQLRAWKEATSLAKEIYRCTGAFPREELYGLSLKLRRCAASIPSNIAEGAARAGSKEFLYYLTIARGSLSELETQIIIAREPAFCTNHRSSRNRSRMSSVYSVV
ncbi:MAG: four helix bundle protein [Rhodospirillaceae bacterium]